MPPSATSSPASATRSSTEYRLMPGSSSFGTVVGADEERHHEVVEVEPRLAHERRSASVRRRRRRRVAGKALTPTIYAARRGGSPPPRVEPRATRSRIRTCRDANGELRIFRFSSAAVILVPPFGRRNQSAAIIGRRGSTVHHPEGAFAPGRLLCPGLSVRWNGLSRNAVASEDWLADEPTRPTSRSGGRFRKGRLWCRPWLRPETGRRCGRVRPESVRAHASAPAKTGASRRSFCPDRPPFGGRAADPAPDRLRHVEREIPSRPGRSPRRTSCRAASRCRRSSRPSARCSSSCPWRRAP